jgi:hypothetical protein
MVRASLALTAVLLCAGTVCAAAPEPRWPIVDAIPAREVDILLSVGREYGLEGDALKLLLVIRKIENGAPGIEMGVASNFPGHAARRYAGNFEKSLRLQAQWAAGTIQKRYTGDLETFAKRYCPPKWQHWTRMARFWMDKV